MKTTNNVHFEAVVPSETGKSVFEDEIGLSSDNIEEFKPEPGRANEAARKLMEMGFHIHHIGKYSISGEASKELWEKTFNTKVKRRKQVINETHPEPKEKEFLSHIPNTPFKVPKELQNFIERIYPQVPATYFESAIPPRVKYEYLNVPSDVSTILKSSQVHKEGITGKGVLVAMPDSGFYKHPFYDWNGYNYNAILAPDANELEKDEIGHGTAEAANIFANAPDIDFLGVKMGSNPTLGFKKTSDLFPSIMTCSWGYSINSPTLPNFLYPLAMAVVEAVHSRGITVCFSAGNGHYGFPAQMPDVIAVGGVYVRSKLCGSEFAMEASNYASSFDSLMYPGRHVPDICGLVGQKPRGIYIMLPTEPGDVIDNEIASGDSYPDDDETAVDDGWAVISGTSASSPQIAGICALIKQIQPDLPPDLMKNLLIASGRDVKLGGSAMEQPAGPGFDAATGGGLADAQKAYQLAKSIKISSLFTPSTPRPIRNEEKMS